MLCSLGHSRNLAQRLAHGNCLRPVEWLTFKKSRDQGSGFFFFSSSVVCRFQKQSQRPVTSCCLGGCFCQELGGHRHVHFGILIPMRCFKMEKSCFPSTLKVKTKVKMLPRHTHSCKQKVALILAVMMLKTQQDQFLTLQLHTVQTKILPALFCHIQLIKGKGDDCLS